MCTICGEHPIYGVWTSEAEPISACRRCLRHLSIAAIQRKMPLDLTPLTDGEIARLRFVRYLHRRHIPIESI